MLRQAADGEMPDDREGAWVDHVDGVRPGIGHVDAAKSESGWAVGSGSARRPHRRCERPRAPEPCRLRRRRHGRDARPQDANGRDSATGTTATGNEDAVAEADREQVAQRLGEATGDVRAATVDVDRDDRPLRRSRDRASAADHVRRRAQRRSGRVGRRRGEPGRGAIDMAAREVPEDGVAGRAVGLRPPAMTSSPPTAVTAA